MNTIRFKIEIMERTIETLFYHFSQNNSGGYYIRNNEFGVCENLIIEAKDTKEAANKLNELGEKVPDFWDYCSCCGERWSTFLLDDDGDSQPCIWGTPVSDYNKDGFNRDCFVHYYDGTFKKFELNG